MKILQKIVLIISMIFVVGHNVLDHAHHDDHLFCEASAPETLWEYLKDVFAFGGGDEHLDNTVVRKCVKCQGLTFDYAILAKVFESLIVPETYGEEIPYPSDAYLSELRPQNYIPTTHSLRGSPCFSI